MKCSHENCKLAVYDNEKCILHSDKKDKDINKFWQQIQSDLKLKYTCERGQEEIDNHYVQYNFVIFPEFQKDSEYDHYNATCEISNFYFGHESYFSGYCEESPESYDTDKLIEKCHIEFNRCTFLEEVNLQRYRFQESIIFNQCTFEKEVLLCDILNAYIEFRSCDFNNNKLNLSDKTFYKIFNFIDCKNIDLLNMENINFIDSASFSESNLNKVEFNEARFGGMAIFVKTHFYEDTKIDFCVFEENVFFNEAIVHKTINLKNAIFKKEVNFLDMKDKNEKVLKALNIANRETARIIKHSFEKLNNILEANKYYAIEMKKREKELSFCTNPFELLIFCLHKITSNNSQSWQLAFIWIIVLSILGIQNNLIDSVCAFYYSNAHLDEIAKSFYRFFASFDIQKITFYSLSLKLFMGYLVYQFIVSIRQNTRRK